MKTIMCMDTSGCKAAFSEAELSRLLSSTSLELYHRLKTAKELEQAAIEGLEMCPYCPWAIVIDNPNEKLFRCLNPSCLQVSCRGCKHAVSSSYLYLSSRIESEADGSSRSISLKAVKVRKIHEIKLTVPLPSRLIPIEAETDRKADRRHAVEDAMSDALIRKCPKCSKPYIKEAG